MKHTTVLIAFAAILLSACHKQTFEEKVIAEVEHFNSKEAPKRLDMYTTFDSMSYDTRSQTLSYYYTLGGGIDASMFPVDPVKQELLNNLRNSLPLKAHKDHNLNFHYIYISEVSGESVIDCIFTPEEYK